MITIGIPVTKVRFLRQTLQSVAAQTSTDYEVVIVDNDADGDVKACIAESGLKQVILHKNSTRIPPIPNWNKVLSLATGEWFILLSDDDYFEPDHLDEMTRSHRNFSQARLVHSRIRLVNEEGGTLQLTATAPEWESGLDFLWHRVHLLRTQFLSDFMYHTASLKKHGGFVDYPGAWCSDDATNFREAIHGGVVFSLKTTLNYRINHWNLSGNSSARSKITAIASYVDWLQSTLAGLQPEGSDVEIKEQIIKNLPIYERALSTMALASVSVPHLLQMLPDALRGKLVRSKPVKTWLKAFDQAVQRRFSPRQNTVST